MSFHVEVPANGDLVTIHGMIDHIEREIYEKFGIEAVIHMDPVCADCRCGEMRELAESAAKSLSPNATIHDLQVESSAAGTKVYFDIVIPFGLDMTDEEAAEAARAFINAHGAEAVIRIEHPLIESR